MRTVKLFLLSAIVILISGNLYGAEVDTKLYRKNNNLYVKSTQDIEYQQAKYNLFKKIKVGKKYDKIKTFNKDKPKIEKYALRSFIFAVGGITLSGFILLASFFADAFLLGLLLSALIMFVSGIFALIYSIKSLKRLKKAEKKQRGKALSVTALILSITEIISPAIIIAAIIAALSGLSLDFNF